MHDRNALRPAGHHAPGYQPVGPQRFRGPVDSGLAGTGLVADDLYLMAHHDVSGRALLQPRPLGIGLGGALLAELMLGGGITLRPDGAVLAGRTWPGEDLARQVRDQVATEQEPRPVREWLLFLARNAAQDVAGRLERAGYLTRVRSWVPWRPARCVPVDSDWALASLLRVRSALDPARPFAAHEAALAGLAVASGLGFRLDQYLPPAGRSPQEAVALLGPDLHELIGQTQAAVGSALLSHRT
jgi:hypothetical protein